MVALEVEAPQRHVRAIVNSVCADMMSLLDESATEISESIHDHVDGLPDDLYLATRQSTRANLGLITTMLGEGAGPTGFAAPEEALAYAREYVHEGLSLEQLTRAYHQGQKAYSRMWLERFKGRVDRVDELADAMGYFSDWLFAYIEWINHPLSEVYTAEHERYVRGGVAMRLEEVRSILAGARVNVHEASTRLRYRLEGCHLGFVIWSDDCETADGAASDGSKLFGEMERFAGEVAAALGATGSLSLPLGRHFAGWASVNGAADLDALPDGRHGLRVAVGRPGRGLEGFRRTHAEALEARRVARLFQRAPTGCTSFEAVALDALMTRDMEEARRFVASELGGLLDDSDGARRLAATLEVFLQEGSSFVGAARRLGIHENTVAYRIRRAEDLLQRKTTERQLELRTALRLARFGTGPVQAG
jgi:hypothetical protein